MKAGLLARPTRRADAPSAGGPRASAFTLVELLVVLGIIAVLVAILLPIYGSVTKAKNTAVCLSNLRQLGAATLTYCNDNNGYFPPPNSFPPYTTTSDAPWNKRMFSYLGLASDQLATPLLKCPTDPRPYKVSSKNYARSYTFSSTSDFQHTSPSIANGGLMQTNGLGGGAFRTRTVAQVSQPSQTLMITEWWTSSGGAVRENFQESYNFSTCGGWAPVASVPKFTDGKTYYHSGRFINAVFVDGHAAGLTPVELVGNFDQPTANPKIWPFTAIR